MSDYDSCGEEVVFVRPEEEALKLTQQGDLRARLECHECLMDSSSCLDDHPSPETGKEQGMQD